MSTIVIRYDGTDITSLCSIEETWFSSRAGGTTPGECQITFRDTRQKYQFITGKTLELIIDGVRQWDGFLMKRGYNYWFETHTANCEPCPHVTPRKLILYGADRNILFTRRVLYNKGDPATAVLNLYPADTSDRDALLESFDQFLEDIDGIDLESMVEEVGSPDPYVEFGLPGPTSLWGELMRETAASVGAVFYIDPDRKLVYTDVDDPDAPFGISDRPGDGEIGCRDLEITKDASNMVNDALIWGAGQGSAEVRFRRVTDAASVAAHGRWQNSGGYRVNLFNEDSIQRVAHSIVYGSPTSLRGHKDDQVSARCVIFTPGFRVAQKVPLRVETHPFEDVIPIREIRTSFINPEQPRFELSLSHEMDEPWTTNEYWWPEDDDDDDDDTTDNPTQSCDFPTFIDSGLGVVPDPQHEITGVDSHRSQWGLRRDQNFSIEVDGLPSNKTWFEGDTDFRSCTIGGLGGELTHKYQMFYDDKFWYNSGDGDLQVPGSRQWSFQTEFQRFDAGDNSRWPSAGFIVHVKGTMTLTGSECDRDVTGQLFPFPTVTENNGQGIGPHLCQLLMVGSTGACLGARQATSNPDTSRVLASATLQHGESFTFEAGAYVRERAAFFIAPMIHEPAPRKPVVRDAVLTITDLDVQWTAAMPGGTGTPPPGEGACVDGVPLNGSYCGEAFEMTPTLYRTPTPYTPGSTKVYVDGIQQRLNNEYEETDPQVGRITFYVEPAGPVQACYLATGIWQPTLPDTATALFILPVGDVLISGTFGAQDANWSGAYWHGQWFDHFHNGVDFAVGVGTPVYAAADGDVVFEDQAAGGTMIHIYHNFHGMRTTYAHLSSRIAPNNSFVTQGTLIGYSGESGQVSGPHLHWGLVVGGSPEDPMPYTGRATEIPPGTPAPGPTGPTVTVDTLMGRLSSARPGDVLELEPGTYTGMSSWRGVSGSSGAPITLRGQAGVVFDGGGKRQFGNSSCHDLVVEDIEIRNYHPTGTGVWSLTDCTNVTLRRVKIRDCGTQYPAGHGSYQDHGLYLGQNCRNVDFDDCDVDGGWRSGGDAQPYLHGGAIHAFHDPGPVNCTVTGGSYIGADYGIFWMSDGSGNTIDGPSVSTNRRANLRVEGSGVTIL